MSISIIKIKKFNNPQFLEDLGKVRDVMVYVPRTDTFFKITKTELLKEAEKITIYYKFVDTVFRNKRTVMVIL